MKYRFKNEELLFLCALIKGKVGIGIENTLEDKTEDTIASKWKNYEKTFVNQGYLFYNQLDQLKMKKEIGEIVKLIMDADYTFACLREDYIPKMQYIYYTKDRAMYMTNEEGICEIEYFHEHEAFKAMLCEVIQLNEVDQGDEKYFVNIPAKKLEQVLELVGQGHLDKGMDVLADYGFNQEVLEHLIEAVEKEDNTVNIQGTHRKMIRGQEVIFKAVTTKYGTWLIKFNVEIQKPFISIYKLGRDELIAGLFSF